MLGWRPLGCVGSWGWNPPGACAQGLPALASGFAAGSREARPLVPCRCVQQLPSLMRPLRTAHLPAARRSGPSCWAGFSCWRCGWSRAACWSQSACRCGGVPTVLLSIFSEESWHARVCVLEPERACGWALLSSLVIRFGQGTAGESRCRMLETDCLRVGGWVPLSATKCVPCVRKVGAGSEATIAARTCRRFHGNPAVFTFPTCAQLPPTNQPSLARNSTCLAGAERGAEAACAGRCCAVPRAGLRRHSGQRQQGGGRPRPGLPGKGLQAGLVLGAGAAGLVYTRLPILHSLGFCPLPTRCCSCP